MHAFSIQSPVNLQAKPNKLVKPELSAGPSRDVRALTKGGHILVFRFDLLIPKSAEDLFFPCNTSIILSRLVRNEN